MTTAAFGFTIRPALHTDRPAVETLLERASLPLAGVAAAFDDFIVAEVGGRVIGAGGLEIGGDHALLRSTIVEPTWRGKHLGQSITARLLHNARERGVESVWLLTPSAERFFYRFGFRAVSRGTAPAAIQATTEFSGVCSSTVVPMTRRAQPLRVLFVCTGNVARSQLGEALLAHAGGDLVSVGSAGVAPGYAAHPLAVRVLEEEGIDWHGKVSKGMDEVMVNDWDLVITVCDDARESCPVIPGAASAHWGLDDPSKVRGSNSECLNAFRGTRNAIGARITKLLELPWAILSAKEIAEAATRIHDSADR